MRNVRERDDGRVEREANEDDEDDKDDDEERDEREDDDEDEDERDEDDEDQRPRATERSEGLLARPECVAICNDNDFLPPEAAISVVLEAGSGAAAAAADRRLDDISARVSLQ